MTRLQLPVESRCEPDPFLLLLGDLDVPDAQLLTPFILRGLRVPVDQGLARQCECVHQFRHPLRLCESVGDVVVVGNPDRDNHALCEQIVPLETEAGIVHRVVVVQ